jgi:hypothetical protein
VKVHARHTFVPEALLVHLAQLVLLELMKKGGRVSVWNKKI